jgi:hypothetical protein
LIKIRHRVNTSSELRTIDTRHGIEIDLRSYGEDVIVTHDVFREAETFVTWIKSFQHGPLILNVKEEGIEERILEVVKSAGVKDYFFLDQSFPYLVRTLRSGNSRTALRFSDFESVETALLVTPRPNWIWADSFSGDWNHLAVDAERLHGLGYKICVAAPELHGRDDEGEREQLAKTLQSKRAFITAICTKVPDQWN